MGEYSANTFWQNGGAYIQPFDPDVKVRVKSLGINCTEWQEALDVHGFFAINGIPFISHGGDPEVINFGDIDGSGLAGLEFYTDGGLALGIDSSRNANHYGNVRFATDGIYSVGENAKRAANVYADFVHSTSAYFLQGVEVAIYDGSFLIGDAEENGIDVEFKSESANIRMYAANSNIEMNGYMKPFSSTDTAAPNNSIYYSTTQSKLVYKDSGGTVNSLY